MWTHRVIKMQNPWNMQYLENELWSDQDTCTSNLRNKPRHKGIKTMHIGVELLYDHGGTTHGYLTQRFPCPTMNDSGQYRKSPIESRGVPNECHVWRSSPRSPNRPSHHKTEHEEEQDQRKMPRNKEGSETERICAQVPCADYPRERERRQIEPSQQSTKR